MKRKSLLLIIPFAAVGLAGCGQNKPDPNPPAQQCDTATFSIETEGVKSVLTFGETLQLVGKSNVDNCTATWSSSASDIVDVDDNGLVTAGEKEGTATIYYGGESGGKITFIVSAKEINEYTPERVIAMCDEAGSGVVVDEELIVVGVVASGSTHDDNGWNGQFEGSDLKFSSVRTTEDYGSSIDGCTVKIQGYAELYNGSYKIGYLPAASSPTKEKYNPTLISVTRPQGKEVVEVVSVASAPSSVVVGGTVSASSVKLNIKYSDESSGVIPATKVEVITSVAADSVEGKAWYNDLGPVTFNIKVVAQGQAVYGTEDDPISVSQAIDTMTIDCPASNNLTKQAMYCVGTVKEIKNVYHYEDDIGSDCFELVLTDGTKDVIVYRLHSTDDLKDQVAEGNEIKICGYGKNYNGTLEFVDNGATKCTLLDNSAPDPEKQVVEVLGVKSHPETVVVGGTIAASSVVLNVKLNDGSETTKPATRVECNTQVAADSVEATAWYNEVGSAKFNIKVVAQGQAVYGTEDDPISVSQAIDTMTIDCPASNNLTKQAMYCVGTVKEIKNVYHYEDDIGSDCFELVLTDGTKDVIVYRLHATDDLKDQVAEGNEIKICGYGKNYNGTLEFVDNGATKCTLLNNGTPTPQKEVTGITAASYSKTLYVGGTIAAADVTLTVTYSDGTSGSVKAQNVDGYSTASAGNTTATAYYGTFTKEFVVEVKEKPAPSGDSFNLVKSNEDISEGQYLIVYGSKSFNGVDKTANYATVEVADESIEASDTLVYVEFEKMSGGYAIKVVGGDNDSKYIYGQSGQNKLLFDANQKLNTISVSDDGKATIVSETSILKFNTNTGTSDDRFRYYKSTNTDEKMALPSLYKMGTPAPKKEITSVELQGTLAKSSYIAGQTFDPEGLSVKVNYSDTTSEVVTSGFTFNVVNPLAVGEFDLKATYQGHTTEGSVHISVVAKELVSIAITHGMNKTAYQVDDEWDATGIVVQGTYNDGDIQTIASTSYELSFDPIKATGTDVTSVNIVATMNAGEEISSQAYPQTVTVQTEPVPEPVLDSISVDASKAKTTYTEGESVVKDGLVVTAHYTNGGEDKVLQAAEYSVSPSGALTTEDKTVTVSYEGKSNTYAITVNPKSEEKGTEDNPFTADEAYAYAESLGSGVTSTNDYWVKGAVTKIESAFSSEFKNITLQLTTSAGKVFKLYRVTTTQAEADTISVGTIVTVKGKITNYNGTTMETAAGAVFTAVENKLSNIEISGSAKIQKGTKSTYTAVAVPSLASLGTVTWSIDSGDSYISLPETKTGSSIEVTAVAAGNAVLKATCGDINKTFAITVSEEAAIDPYECTFAKDTKASSYTGTSTQSLGNISWILNGNASIDNYVKLSSGTANTTADRYICTQTAFSNPVTVFSLITGAKDDAATVNSITLTVHSSADDAKSGANAIESVTATWVADGTISFNKPATSSWSGKYFRVTFNLSNTTKNKGIIVKGAKVEF